MDDTTEYADVEIPVKREPGRKGPRFSLKTQLHKQKLLEIFRFPPGDFDGSNRKLCEYMGLSSSQLIRLMNKLRAEGSIRTSSKVHKHAAGGVFTKRTIQVLKEKV